MDEFEVSFNKPRDNLPNFEPSRNNTIEEIELLMKGTKKIEGDKYLSQLFYKGCSFIYDEDYHLLLKYGENLLEYSKLLNSKHYETKAYNLIGIAKLNMFLYKDSLYFFEKGLSLSDDIRTKAAILLNLSEIYIRLNKLDKSMICVNEVIGLAREITYERLIFKATVKRSELMLLNDDVFLAKANCDTVNNLISSTLTNIDMYYMYLVKSKIHLKQSEFQEALKYLIKAENIVFKLDMKKLNILVWHRFSEVYFEMKALDQSMYYAKMAYSLSLKLDDIHYRCNTCEMIGKVYEENGDFHLALKFLKKTLSYKSIMTSQMFSFDDEVSYQIEQENLVEDSKIIELKNKQLKLDNKKITDERNMLLYIKDSFIELQNLNVFTDIMINIFNSINHMIHIDELNLVTYDRTEDTAIYSCKIEQGSRVEKNENSPVINKNILKDFTNQNAHYMNHNTLFEKNTEPHATTHCYVKLSSEKDIYKIVEIRKIESGRINLLEEEYLIQYLAFLNIFLSNEYDHHNNPSKNELNMVDYYKQLNSSAGITKREFEIITKVSEGCSNKMISIDLNISPNTVRNHLNRIFSKLGVKTRYELINYTKHS